MFDEHTNKFKQQNDIITNIFHGFGHEINTIKDELSCRPQNQYSEPRFYTAEDGEGENNDSIEEEQRRKFIYFGYNHTMFIVVQYMTTNSDQRKCPTLEEVKEETSKGIDKTF